MNPNPITKCVQPVFLKERKARNPLLCEKTPRTHQQDLKDWTYQVPPGEKFAEKWDYNAEDRPLMERFESVVGTVAAENKKMAAYNGRIKAFQDSQALLASQPAQVTVRESARGSARSTARSTGRLEADHELASTSRSMTGRSIMTGRSDHQHPFPASSARASARSEKDLTAFPVSSLKTLHHEHPEVLAKMRAQRATKYVTALRNPLDPPAYNSISSRQGFFPAGTNTLHPNNANKPAARGPSSSNKKKSTLPGGRSSSSQIVLTSRNLDTARMKESLVTLVDELAKTDSEIQRQELKIALAPKVKTYGKK